MGRTALVRYHCSTDCGVFATSRLVEYLRASALWLCQGRNAVKLRELCQEEYFSSCQQYIVWYLCSVTVFNGTKVEYLYMSAEQLLGTSVISFGYDSCRICSYITANIKQLVTSCYPPYLRGKNIFMIMINFG